MNLSARHGEVVWERDRKYFMFASDKRKLAGVDAKAKKVFCRTKFKVPQAKGKVYRLDAETKGLRGGSKIHRQVGKWVALSQTSKGGRGIYPLKMCMQARRVAEEVDRRGWTPMYAEYAIGDRASGIGTALDLLCRDPATQRVHYIELKTGFHGTWTMSSEALLPPVDMLRNSPKDLAIVQAALGDVLLRKWGTSHVTTHVWLVQQGDDGAVLEDTVLPPSMVAAGEAMLAKMAVYPSRTKDVKTLGGRKVSTKRKREKKDKKG